MHIKADSYARCKYLGELFCIISDCCVSHENWDQRMIISFKNGWQDRYLDINALSIYFRNTEHIIFRSISNDVRFIQELWVTRDQFEYKYQR